MKTKSILAGAAAAAAALTLTAAPSFATDAVSDSICDGAAADVVRTDIEVAAGEACYLENVTIRGNVTLEENATLVISDSVIKGRVTLDKNAYFDAYKTNVTRDIVGEGASLYLDHSWVTGRTLIKNAEQTAPYTYAEHANLWGRVNIQGSEAYISDTRAYDGLTLTDGDFASLFKSTALGQVNLRNNVNGATVCGSDIIGTVNLNGNNGAVIGNDADGLCTKQNWIEGGAFMVRNTGDSRIGNTTIQGYLSGFSNDPKVVVGDMTCASRALGEFRGLTPCNHTRPNDIGAFSLGGSLEEDQLPENVLSLKERAAADREAAIAAAKAAGPAFS